MADTPVVVGLAQPFDVGRLITQPVLDASPAAGAGFTHTFGSKYWDRVVALTFRLVTDGNAANRQVALAFQDADAHVFAKAAAPFTQSATKTTDYTFALGLNQGGANDAAVIAAGIPGPFMQPEWACVVSIANVQVGDQVSRIVFLLDRYPTGPEGYQMGAYVVDNSPDVIAESV